MEDWENESVPPKVEIANPHIDEKAFRTVINKLVPTVKNNECPANVNHQMFLHPSMFKCSLASPTNELKSLSKGLFQFVWPVMADHAKVLVNNYKRNGMDIPFWAEVGDKNPRDFDCRSQGECAEQNFLTREVVAGPILYPHLWGLGSPNEPTRIPEWLRRSLSGLKDAYGELIVSEDRDGEFVFNLVLEKGTVPLIDRVKGNACPPELRKIVDWISESRSLPPFCNVASEGIVLDLNLASAQSQNTDEYHEKADIEGKRCWSLFIDRAEKSFAKLNIPGVSSLFTQEVAVPMSFDVEMAMSIRGTDQPPNVAQSIQVTLLDAHLTILLPCEAHQKLDLPRLRQSTLVLPPRSKPNPRTGEEEWAHDVSYEVPVVIVPKVGFGLDHTTLAVINTGKFNGPSGTIAATLFATGSGVTEDLTLLMKQFNQVPDRKIVPGNVVETHRLARAAHLFNLRVPYGVAMLSIVTLGTLCPPKLKYIYTRLYHHPPEEIQLGLSSYQAYDTFIGQRIEWTLIISFLLQCTPFTSVSSDILASDWYPFQISNLLSQNSGLSATPECDRRRFTTSHEQENDILARECFIPVGENNDSWKVWDINGSPQCLHSNRSNRCYGHEGAIPPPPGTSKKIKNKREKRKISVYLDELEKACEISAAAFRVRCNLSPLFVTLPNSEESVPASPLLESDSGPLVGRLHWELAKVFAASQKEEFDQAAEVKGSCADKFMFYAAVFIRERLGGMVMQKPYLPRILSRDEVTSEEVIFEVEMVTDESLFTDQACDNKGRPEESLPLVVESDETVPFSSPSVNYDFVDLDPPQPRAQAQFLLPEVPLQEDEGQHESQRDRIESRRVRNRGLPPIWSSEDAMEESEWFNSFPVSVPISALPRSDPEEKEWLLLKRLFVANGSQTTRILRCINPVGVETLTTFTKEENLARTGMEGFELIKPTEAVSWTESWQDTGAVFNNDWKGDLPSFATRGVHRGEFRQGWRRERLMCFIKHNRRHFSVLNLLKKVGHQLRPHPPVEFDSWDGYRKAHPELITLYESPCKELAEALGITIKSGGIISSSVQLSSEDVARRRTKSIKRKRERDAAMDQSRKVVLLDEELKGSE